MKLKDIPMNKVREVMGEGKDAEKQRQEPIAISVLIDPSAPRELVECLKGALVPSFATASVSVALLEKGKKPTVRGGLDVCLVVAGGDDELTAPAVHAATAVGVPCCVIAQASVDAPSLDTSGNAAIVASSDPDDLLERLGSWIVDNSSKDLAFAANFPFVRGPKVDQLIRVCAAENAAVGAVALLPGADMPIMTANQAKLALDIAAVYGQDLSAGRLPELAAVVGGGFAYRAAARQLLGLIPGIGIAIKAGMGYAGTLTTGEALRARFELGEDGSVDVVSVATGLRDGLRDAVDTAAKSQLGQVASQIAKRIASKGDKA